MESGNGKLTIINAAAAGLLICFILSSCYREENYTPPPGSTDMAITHYAFGEMTIDGTNYEDDIAIGPDKRVKQWRTRIRHYIQLSDVKDLIDDSTKALIIGIGADKGCRVGKDLIDFTESNGIEIRILDTYKAVREFNASPKTDLSACFHLNC